ncbi:retrovirus-related pol polyprotein from transposon TNT 1-94 [Tanacetum coccineum]
MMLYEALEKSMARDNSDQLLSDLAKARKKSLCYSKTAALAVYMAWTTTDTGIKPSVSPIPKEHHMDDDTTSNKQAYSSSGEDGLESHDPARAGGDLPRDNPLVSVEVLSIHSEDGNPARVNIKQALGLHKDGDADASFHGNSSGKRLASLMVVEAWLSEKDRCDSKDKECFIKEKEYFLLEEKECFRLRERMLSSKRKMFSFEGKERHFIFMLVYEDEMKRSSSSTSTSQNLAFLSSWNTSSYNECYTIKEKGTSLLGNADLALVAQDGLGGYNWSNDFEVEPVNYALMAISSSSSSSSSDNEVQNCSKQCLESFKTLQKNYDSEREKHSRARLEIFSIACDEETTPANDRFSKADGYHVVPPPITGNFLTLRADISFKAKGGKGSLRVVDSGCSRHMTSKQSLSVQTMRITWRVVAFGCDNGTEFKNHAMNEFCAKKGIKKEFSVARTLQQNGVAERKNKTLIKAARTMVLVTKPQNKTPYELLLGKFDGKSDEGYLHGYSTSSKAFRVYNKRTKRVEENLHINFLEDQPNVAGTGSSRKDKGPTQEYILLPLQPHRTRTPVEDVYNNP